MDCSSLPMYIFTAGHSARGLMHLMTTARGHSQQRILAAFSSAFDLRRKPIYGTGI